MTLRVFSSGGGVQSTAALVLSAQGVIDFPIHLFCNVGDDSEHPATLEYVRNIVMPYAKANGIEFHELRREGDTLYQSIMKSGSTRVGIPVYMETGAPSRRACTADFKIAVVRRWMRKQGAKLAIVGLGISTDEWKRVKTSNVKWVQNSYPLIDLRLSRQDCVKIIAKAGLGSAPKSACFACPFHRTDYYIRLRDHEPLLFERAAALEDMINVRRHAKKMNSVFISKRLLPLREAVQADRLLFDDAADDTCESGYCMV